MIHRGAFGCEPINPGEVVDHPNALVPARQPQPAPDISRWTDDDQLLAFLASLRVRRHDRANPDPVNADHVPEVEDHTLEPRLLVGQRRVQLPGGLRVELADG